MRGPATLARRLPPHRPEPGLPPRRLMHAWRLSAALLLTGLAATGPAGAGEIVLYEHDAYRGRTFVANQSASNFADVGFNDRASSVIIRSGAWQLCTDAYFRGRCVTLGRGEYPSLRAMDLNDAVSSVRDVEWVGGGPGAPVPPIAPPGGGAFGGRIEVFDGAGFAGNRLAFASEASNLAQLDFSARSLIVHEGTWEGCDQANFGGTCRNFPPGRYPNLAAMGARLSSIRPYAAPPLPPPPVVLPPTGPGPGGPLPGWGGRARAILYDGPQLRGRAFVIDNEVVSNLADLGFNDRAASLRVEAGYWLFCSDAHFGGECRTFGPGDYPTLPWGLSDRISSGRRIHGNYPYRNNPNWQR